MVHSALRERRGGSFLQRVTLMPVVAFESLPDASRVWVFASDPALPAAAAKTMLSGVDSHLKEWKAHGEPLTVSREWIEDRFLVVAVDQTHTGASGCSIDGLFRVLQQLENSVHASLVGGGRVYYRDHHGVIQAVGRGDIDRLVHEGEITKDTVVFDTTLSDLGDWRRKFERPARESWVGELIH